MTGYFPAWFVLCLLSAGLPRTQARAELRNADVVMVFETDAAAPRLLTLEPSGQAPWANRVPESLIEVAERGGDRVALRFHRRGRSEVS